MGRSWTIDVPGTIPAKLTPNGMAPNPYQRGKLFKQVKKDAYWAAVEVLGLEPPKLATPIRLDYRIEWENGRKLMDDDNAKSSMKAVQDGIAKAVGIDDRHFIQGGMEQLKTKNLGGRIIVTLTEGG